MQLKMVAKSMLLQQNQAPSQKKEASTNDARSSDNNLTLTKSFFTPRQVTKFDPKLSTSKPACSTLNLVSPYYIKPVPEKKQNF